MPDYRSGAGIGLGLTMLGGGIGSMLGARRRRKAMERLAQILAEEKKQPMAGKAISELAKVLGGVGRAMPIPEHMGGNALPFGSTPVLSPDQAQQLTPPNVINQQNAQAAKIRALITSGTPEGEALGLQMAMPSEKPEEWARASDTIIFNKSDGSYRELPRGELTLRENEILMRLNPETGQFEEAARGLPKATTPPKPDYVAAETSPGKYTLVPRDFAAAHGLTIKKDQQGISLGYDAEGRPAVQIGGVPSVASTAGKKVQGDIETDMHNAEKGLLRMENILGNFDESYLTTPTQLINWGRDKWERLGLSLSETGREKLTGYTTFETFVLGNLNLYIKEITGAQMGETEAERLMKAMPTMEQGPTKFKARALAIKAALRASHDAYYQARLAGKSHEQAQAIGDRASIQAYYEAEGGGFHAGPAIQNMPEPPSGYTWEQRPDGVNRLVPVGGG